MGVLGTILGFLLPALIGVGATWLSNRVNNSSLTGAQTQQNTYNSMEAQYQRDWSTSEREASQAFNSVEAQKNRDFQAQQVQNQMDFQERMDNTLYQRRVADMMSAGVNPALAVGGIHVGSTAGAAGAGSAASSSPGSGVAASGSAPAFASSMSDIMQAAFFRKNLSMLDSQIQMNDAKTMRDLAEAGLLGEQRIGQNLSNSWFLPMKEAELANLESDLRSKGVQRALARQNIKESEAREALTLTQDIIAKADAETRDELNRASLRLTLRQAEYYGALGAESAKRTSDLIPAEVNELYQRSIMQAYEAGKFSADELESMERVGLIRVQREGQEMENQIKSIHVDNRKLDYFLGVAGQTASIIGDVAGGAGRLIGGIAVGSKFKGLQIPQGSSLWLPKSQSAFGAQYQFK